MKCSKKRIQILWGEFYCLDNNLENFQNDGNLWSILLKLNLENFKWHLKVKNFKILLYYIFFKFCILVPKIFNLTPINFQTIANWPLNFFKNYNLTPQNFWNLQIDPNFNSKIWSKNDYNDFFITLSKQKYWEMKVI